MLICALQLRRVMFPATVSMTEQLAAVLPLIWIAQLHDAAHSAVKQRSSHQQATLHRVL